MNPSIFCVMVLVVLATIYIVPGGSSLHGMLKSIDQTCNHIHGILTYQRRILNITVTKEAPLRVKIDMELVSQDLLSPKQYLSVEGMVCHNGFDRNAANTACRSQKKKLQMFSQNYEWEPTPNDLHDKCYFSYNGDPFIVGCNFVFDNFNCPSSATSLLDCTHSPLFEQHCTKSMHVGVFCSGTDVQTTTTTTTTTVTTTIPERNILTMFGVQHNIDPSSLPTGWSVCYQGLYSNVLSQTGVANILQACNKRLLLLACRPVGQVKFTVAAMGNRNDVLYNCSTKADCTNIANGVGWYFSDHHSWGFVNGTEIVYRNQCDTRNANSANGLCWHTNIGSGGYQCGNKYGHSMNSDSTYQRLIYHSN